MKKNVISPFWYYVMMSSLVSIAFILIGVIPIAIYPPKIKSAIALMVILILMLTKSGVVAIVASLYHKTHNKEFVTRFVGFYFGGFYGLIDGALMGVMIAKFFNYEITPSSILGALLFYFVGRWIGPKISFGIDALLAKAFSTEMQGRIGA